MLTPETYSDYTIFNDEMNSVIESARPREFSEYGAVSNYAYEVEEAIRGMLGEIDSEDCGEDEDTLTALRDRLDSFADELDRADDLCDYMDIGFTWDDDALDFYRENQSVCDDVLADYYGGPAGTDCDTAMQVVVSAANCGLDSIVRRAADEWTSNLESEIRAMIEDIDELLYEFDDDDDN